MEGEVDLFASTSLISAFNEPSFVNEPSRASNKSNEFENANGRTEQPYQNAELDNDSDYVLEVEQTDQEELIVLDETGSSDSESANENNSPNKSNTVSVNDDQDIEIIETKSSPVVEVVPQNPLEITLEDDVVYDKRSHSCQNCYHRIELARLSKENASLRQQLVQQDSKLSAINNSKLGIEVRFLKSSSAKNFQKLFENFIQTLESNEDEKEVKNDTNDAELFSDFCIDKSAADTSRSSSNVWRVPRYNQDVKQVLQPDEVEVIAEESPKARMSCFNCLGDHMISKCPKEKDRRRIAENREAFMNKSLSKQTRYHADEDIRFANFRPGKISDELRRALSLSKYDVPFYIYKMRLLGYPPGWLKEAEITSSGLTVYDSEGKEVIEGNVEDGELYDASSVRVQHDPEKLIEFPGFNVFLPYGYRDNHARYGFPPIQDCHLKSNFGKSMKVPEAQPYKRRVSQIQTDSKRLKTTAVDTNLEDVDMEIEEINLEAKDEADEEPKPSTSHEDDNQDSLIPEINICNSPSLEELEQVKKNLLDVLSTNSASLAFSSDTNGSQQSANSLSELECETDFNLSKNQEENNTNSTTAPEKIQVNNGLERQPSVSKHMQLGCPSIIRFKHHSLPSRENFSVGITEHLPFENLPGTTGQFEKLRDVLKAIRSEK